MWDKILILLGLGIWAVKKPLFISLRLIWIKNFCESFIFITFWFICLEGILYTTVYPLFACSVRSARSERVLYTELCYRKYVIKNQKYRCFLLKNTTKCVKLFSNRIDVQLFSGNSWWIIDSLFAPEQFLWKNLPP